MMYGAYGAGGKELPRVLHVSVARYRADLPKPGEPLEFLLSIHEEGTGITWQQNLVIDHDVETLLLDMTQDLYLWGLNKALTPDQAHDRARQLGDRIFDAFFGSEGEKILSSITPTAILLDIDETIHNLPWELIRWSGSVISQCYPIGRLVTTRVPVRPGRDPMREDAVVRILAVANPTSDLPTGEHEVEVLQDLQEKLSGIKVQVDVLPRNRAKKTAFLEKVVKHDYDILHFSGHGTFDRSAPGQSIIRFADSSLSADEVLNLAWKKPPYFVFNSACESGRAAAGVRLVSRESQSNGLAAAFLAAGVYAYAGFFWPVTEVGAGMFAREFYRALFQRENFGLAFLQARQLTAKELADVGDLTAFSAVLYGDAASSHRRDLAKAV